MPWYNDLRPPQDHKEKDYALVFPEMPPEDKKRCIQNLVQLRKGLGEKVPLKSADDSLLLCSWNLKEFGHLDKRLPETYFYIAEIIDKFDLVAIQEIKGGLNDLHIIMRLLGRNWGYIITDITEGRAGNSERFGYIYDKRKVEPSGLSGEIVLWEELTRNSSIQQLKRTPAITGFRAGWKNFAIVNVHLHPGNQADDREHRKVEIELLLAALEEKYRRSNLWNENILLLGDTNIYRTNIDQLALFEQHQFRESQSLMDLPTNVSETEIYDRIFMRVNSFFQLKTQNGKEVAGVLDVFDYVFNNYQPYESYMSQHKEDPSTLVTGADKLAYFDRFWKRNQLSDHNPVWIQIEADSASSFLQHKLNAYT